MYFFVLNWSRYQILERHIYNRFSTRMVGQIQPYISTWNKVAVEQIVRAVNWKPRRQAAPDWLMELIHYSAVAAGKRGSRTHDQWIVNAAISDCSGIQVGICIFLNMFVVSGCCFSKWLNKWGTRLRLPDTVLYWSIQSVSRVRNWLVSFQSLYLYWVYFNTLSRLNNS